jgi:hypothetical protein
MSDQEKLDKARMLYAQGEYAEARELLEEIATDDLEIRLDVLLLRLCVLDHVTENDKLLAAADEGIEIATRLGKDSVRSFLKGKRCFYLFSDISQLVYRRTNLTLASRVFEWVGFSLERDKQEHEAIVERQKQLELKAEASLKQAIEETEQISDHTFRAHQFSTIGDIFSSKYLIDKLAFQRGGRLRSKIANMQFVRRWNFDLYLYDRESRKRITESEERCVRYSERSIEEFGLAGREAEQAHASYNLGCKMVIFNRFNRAAQLARRARMLTESTGELRLLEKIEELERNIANRNRNLRDYVSEMGLDMPEGKHPIL